MQISQIPLIISNYKKTNDMLTIKLFFCYYTIKIIEFMIVLRKILSDIYNLKFTHYMF